MDTNVTQFLVERRVEMAYFPVIVFGYLATIHQTRNYSILLLIATITSPIAFHWYVREFDGVDPTDTNKNQPISLKKVPINSPFRLILLAICMVVYAILFLFGTPIALYLNFTLENTIIVVMTLFYVIFLITSQGHRLFADNDKNSQTTLSDFD